MAAATAILSGAGMGLSAFQTVKGFIDKGKAQKELDNLEVPELKNAFKDIQISTIGSDLMREENARTSANMVDSVQSGGVRSVMGALPRLVGMNNDMNKEGRAYLDGQVQQRDYAIAQDETRLRQMEEQRYQGEIAGLGNAMGVANQDSWSGMRGIMSSLSYGADNGLFNKKPSTDTVV